MNETYIHCRSNPRFVGDPIDVTTGANTDVITDLAQRGPLPFLWTRYYKSARSHIHCSLGWGHAHRFDCLLIRDLDGLRYQDPLGGAVGFEDPVYVDSSAAGLVLCRMARDSYVITQPGKPDQEFHFSAGSDVARLVRLRQGEFTIELRYASTGALCEIVDSRGRLIHVATDSADRVVRLALIDPKTCKETAILLAYEYDRNGNLISARDVYNTTLSFAYDSGNRMTRRTDRRGYSFHFEYDNQGRCIHSRGDDGLLEVFLDYEPDARMTFVRRGDGGQWIYAYNDNKTITQITDPYGNATRFVLDDLGRPAQEIDANGNVTILHYDWRGGHDYRIDANGNVLPTKEDYSGPLDPLAYELPNTPLEWDFGDLVNAGVIRAPQVNDPLLAQFPAPVVNTVLGKTTTYDSFATATAKEDATEQRLQTDDFGQLLVQTGQGFIENWKYDVNGKLVEHRDGDGSLFRFAYRSWNALCQRIDPLGNTTSFDHTVQGLMARITDAGGTVTDYAYDLREKLVEHRENGRLVESYRRDPAGNIVQKTDASGRTLVTWEVGPGNLDKVRILGTGEKHEFEYGEKGRIIKAQTPAGTTTFAYDDEGNLLADQRDGQGVVHEFELNQLVATTYFDRFKISYQTRDNGDLVVQDPTGAEHRFQFGASGLITRHLTNGARELSQFDAQGRCRRKAVIRHSLDSSPWMRSYAYSAAGDLLGVSDTKEGITKYRYDAAHRLIEETPPAGPPRRFEHDAAGNLVLQPGLTNVVIGECNRLKEANREVCRYNDRCHLSERQGLTGGTRYEYDDLDMLVRCDIKGQEWTASYDGLCRRIQKTWQGRTTTYYWDDVRLAAEVRHDGSCRLYVYADQTALAPFLLLEYESLDAAPESGRRYHVFTNQIGAPIRVEDDAGQPVWSARIDPYGKAHVILGSSFEMPLRFPGHYFDQETGLHYNRFRYFSPELGRYLQADPAGQIGGINVYAYPSNPLTVVDINGLETKRPKRPSHPPKGHGSEPMEVGCKTTLPPGMSDEEVQKALQAKLTKLREDMEAAQELGLKEVKAPDGTILKTGFTTTGPCISAVYDKETGNVRYGQNTGEAPTKLNPLLQKRTEDRADEVAAARPMPGQPHGFTPEEGIPGSHSEVHALDRAMGDRPGSKPEDFRIANQRMEDSKTDPTAKKGDPMPCCSNCQCITHGAKDVS